jgi:hypothetical protein
MQARQGARVSIERGHEFLPLDGIQDKRSPIGQGFGGEG